MYEAYLTYINKRKGLDGIYGILGTKIHDSLEEIINQKATPETLLKILNDELEEVELFGIEFPKSFGANPNAIRDNWVANMTHFCKTFQPPKGTFETEKFFIYRIDQDHYLQGYIDLIRFNHDGTISIYDWKTSTNFTKENLIHHGRQLILYAMAMEQIGYKVRDVAWIMLKYVEIEIQGKTKVIKKIIERKNIPKEESKHNVIKIKPYVRLYPFTDALCQETKDYIGSKIKLFETSRTVSEWIPRAFKNDKGKVDTFYCNNLCNHRKTCEHIKAFNESLSFRQIQNDELF